MARPREFDEEKVMQAVKDVFWREGYEGASYADLIDATGLHKGSLYAAYGDKRALYLKALSTYDDMEVAAGVAMLKGKSEGAPPDGRGRIAALLDAVIHAVVVEKDRRGCLLCNAAVDQAPHDEDVSSAVAAGLKKIQRAIEAALAEEVDPGALKETAAMINSVYFGMRVMAKAGVPIAMLKQARNGAMAAIE